MRVQWTCHQAEAAAVREEFPLALCGRGRMRSVPWGPARRQEQESRRWAGPAAAVGLAAGC